MSKNCPLKQSKMQLIPLKNYSDVQSRAHLLTISYVWIYQFISVPTAGAYDTAEGQLKAAAVIPPLCVQLSANHLRVMQAYSKYFDKNGNFAKSVFVQ